MQTYRMINEIPEFAKFAITQLKISFFKRFLDHFATDVQGTTPIKFHQDLMRIQARVAVSGQNDKVEKSA